MTTLHIANIDTEEMSGDPAAFSAEDRFDTEGKAHRTLWFAADGDVLVLPTAPLDDYVAYVTALTGTRPESLRIVVPPVGNAGREILSSDRLADEGFRGALREALGGRCVEKVRAYYPDTSVVSLARALGVADRVPGAGFFGQGGASAANSKAVFRVVAAGIGIPIAPGAVVTDLRRAEQAIAEPLAGGHPVILKQELHSASLGNEILSPVEGVQPFGARRVVVLPDRAAVRAYLAERWPWLTDGGRHDLVVERYFPGARPIYAEYMVTDTGVEFTGEGELLMAPVLDGVVIPAPRLAPQARAALFEAAGRLCAAFRAIGYRGTMSVDGIVTAQGQVLLNETNSRTSGSTHLHDVIGPRIVGVRRQRQRCAEPVEPADRILLERGGWAVPSFAAAARRLADTGLAYDPASRTGVILTCDHSRLDGTLAYCVVAENAELAGKRERELDGLFG